MHSVELLPDAVLDARVRSLWQRLADAGLPSLARHQHPTNRPHVTLAVVEDLEPARPALTRLLASLLPVAVGPAHPVVFPGRRSTLVLELPRTPQLIDLQARVSELLADVLSPAAEHLAPDGWRPHLSVALRLRPEQAETGLALLAGARTASGRLAAGRSYDIAAREVRGLSVGE